MPSPQFVTQVIASYVDDGTGYYVPNTGLGADYFSASTRQIFLDPNCGAMLDNWGYLDNVVIQVTLMQNSSSGELSPVPGGTFYSAPFSWYQGPQQPYISPLSTNATDSTGQPLTFLAGATPLEVNWTVTGVPWTMLYSIEFFGRAFDYSAVPSNPSDQASHVWFEQSVAPLVQFNAYGFGTGYTFSIVRNVPPRAAGSTLVPWISLPNSLQLTSDIIYSPQYDSYGDIMTDSDGNAITSSISMVENLIMMELDYSPNKIFAQDPAFFAASITVPTPANLLYDPTRPLSSQLTVTFSSTGCVCAQG